MCVAVSWDLCRNLVHEQGCCRAGAYRRYFACCWCFPLCKLLHVRVFKCFASLCQSSYLDNVLADSDISLSEGL